MTIGLRCLVYIAFLIFRTAMGKGLLDNVTLKQGFAPALYTRRPSLILPLWPESRVQAIEIPAGKIHCLFPCVSGLPFFFVSQRFCSPGSGAGGFGSRNAFFPTKSFRS